ncbi:MAG: hypothetical protein WA964_19965, partial [Ilumatobacter sp.]|uniref:hypothetical protein n=1 Tax=Ilumatobacter sp. TaxID=1967498 RepID=UPI003C727400
TAAEAGIDYTIRPDSTIILPVGARTPQFHAEDDPDDRPDTPDEIRDDQHRTSTAFRITRQRRRLIRPHRRQVDRIDVDLVAAIHA